MKYQVLDDLTRLLYDESIRPIEYTVLEGGRWHRFTSFYPIKPTADIHAIKFSDGSIWDEINGLRKGH